MAVISAFGYFRFANSIIRDRKRGLLDQHLATIVDVETLGRGLGGEATAIESEPCVERWDVVGEVDGRDGNGSVGNVVGLKIGELAYDTHDEEHGCVDVGAFGGIGFEPVVANAALIAQEVAHVLHVVVRHNLVGGGMIEEEAGVGFGCPTGADGVGVERLEVGIHRGV